MVRNVYRIRLGANKDDAIVEFIADDGCLEVRCVTLALLDKVDEG